MSTCKISNGAEVADGADDGGGDDDRDDGDVDDDVGDVDVDKDEVEHEDDDELPQGARTTIRYRLQPAPVQRHV